MYLWVERLVIRRVGGLEGPARPLQADANVIRRVGGDVVPSLLLKRSI